MTSEQERAVTVIALCNLWATTRLPKQRAWAYAAILRLIGMHPDQVGLSGVYEI